MNYDVQNYSIDNLAKLFEQHSLSSAYIIEAKRHLTYFKSYFEYIQAKTIVVESEYIDKDYLEDYAAYYVKSFIPYKRYCVRLHFFSISFSKDNFIQILNKSQQNLNEETMGASYLGFIVIKPLPETIIGRTCLKTYPFDGRRYFPFIREYKVNLFGLNLEVNSIAYQEQDSIVAACASSAIWVAFQHTGILFQHMIPSPVEITKAAVKYFPYANRHIPNKGLTSEQMAHAIRNVGLEPYLVDARFYEIVKSNIYAYLKCKIPLVFGIELINNNNNNNTSLGWHAITITGYSLGHSTPSKFSNDDFYLFSSRIDKLYAHDDQIGPFSRMTFDLPNKIHNDNSLSTAWLDENKQEGQIRAYPKLLLIPLYNKIRIPFNIILKTIFKYDRLIKDATQNAIPQIEWEIFLSTNNEFKAEIFNDSNLPNKDDLLTLRLPKYIWRTICYCDNKKIELVFDATDIEQGDLLLKVIPYSKDLYDFLKTIATNLNIDDINLHHLRAIVDNFRK